MNNSIENGLIVAILFIIIFIPIYLSVRNSRYKKKKKIKHELYLLGQHHNLSFQVVEQLDSFALVADKIKKVIVKVNLKDYSPELISLENIIDCTLEEKKQGNNIQQLQLVLWDGKQQPLHNIVFYRQYVDNEGHLKRTAQIAAQWEEMIKAIITGRVSFLPVEKRI